MKRIYFIILFFMAGAAFAQQPVAHNPNDQIRSLNWDVIGSVKFEMTDKNELLPIFGESIKRFNNRTFDLKGYLIPIKNGRNQKKFLLATLPINQCYFCGQNGVPVMIMVEMDEAINYTDKPIHVQGTLHLENKDASYAPPISIKNAKIMV